METYVGLAKNFKRRYPKHKNVYWMKQQRVEQPYPTTIGLKKTLGGTQKYLGNYWKGMYQFLTQSRKNVDFAFVKNSTLFSNRNWQVSTQDKKFLPIVDTSSGKHYKLPQTKT